MTWFQVRLLGSRAGVARSFVGEHDAEPPVAERGQVLSGGAGGGLVVDVDVEVLGIGIEVDANVREPAAAHGVHARIVRRHAVEDEAVDQRALDESGVAALDPRHEREPARPLLAAGRDAVQELDGGGIRERCVSG